jgi:hypothetical protein
VKEIGWVAVVQGAMAVERLAWGACVEYLLSNSARNLDSVGEIVSDDRKLLEVVGIRESDPL